MYESMIFMGTLFYLFIFTVGTLLIVFSQYTGLGILVFSGLIIILPITFDIYLHDRDNKVSRYLVLVNIAFLFYIFFLLLIKNFTGDVNRSQTWATCLLYLALGGFGLPFICYNYQQMISDNSITLFQRFKYYLWTELFAFSMIIVFCG